MRLPAPQSDPDYTYVREHDLREWWEPSIQPHAALGYQQRALVGASPAACPRRSKHTGHGCAQDTAGLLLAEGGYRVTLLDIREAHVRYARDRYERGTVHFVVGCLAEAVPSLAAFDAVICTEVLEHVRAPAILLKDIGGAYYS